MNVILQDLVNIYKIICNQFKKRKGGNVNFEGSLWFVPEILTHNDCVEAIYVHIEGMRLNHHGFVPADRLPHLVLFHIFSVTWIL